MTDLSPAAYRDVTLPSRLVHVAAWFAYASGIACIFGIVFLVGLYVGLFAFDDQFGLGSLNDISVIIQYTLALPLVLALHRIVQPCRLLLSRVATVLGVAGMVGAIILQVLLVAGVLSFSQQVGMVIVAFMAILVWFVVIGYLTRSTNRLPNNMLLHVLAGLYFGYPVWAFSLGRRLLRW